MPIAIWGSFLVLIIIFLALDLGVFHRDAHKITVKEALIWTGVWVLISLLFNVFVYYLYSGSGAEFFGVETSHLDGDDAAMQFFTGYVIEKSLSVDNIFVIAMIFSFFNTPAKFQHRILFWGILGAIVLRGIMIAFGVQLIENFQWMIYVFGGLLILSALKMLFASHQTVEPDKSLTVRIAKKIYPLDSTDSSGAFFTKINGKRAMTPLFLALLLIEATDLLFAIDSIPAIFAVTREPFLIFTSNIFAILGLRSLYFALAGMIDVFHYLKLSLVFVLGFVGTKMILAHHYPIPTMVSLLVIISLLVVGIIASLIVRPKVELRD